MAPRIPKFISTPSRLSSLLSRIESQKRIAGERMRPAFEKVSGLGRLSEILSGKGRLRKASGYPKFTGRIAPPLRRSDDEDEGTELVDDNNVFPHPFRKHWPTSISLFGDRTSRRWDMKISPSGLVDIAPLKRIVMPDWLTGSGIPRTATSADRNQQRMRFVPEDIRWVHERIEDFLHVRGWGWDEDRGMPKITPHDIKVILNGMVSIIEEGPDDLQSAGGIVIEPYRLPRESLRRPSVFPVDLSMPRSGRMPRIDPARWHQLPPKAPRRVREEMVDNIIGELIYDTPAKSARRKGKRAPAVHKLKASDLLRDIPSGIVRLGLPAELLEGEALSHRIEIDAFLPMSASPAPAFIAMAFPFALSCI